MITRAQAEALLTLAESLEACERLGFTITLSPRGFELLHGYNLSNIAAGKLDGLSVRLYVSDRAPNSET